MQGKRALVVCVLEWERRGWCARSLDAKSLRFSLSASREGETRGFVGAMDCGGIQRNKDYAMRCCMGHGCIVVVVLALFPSRGWGARARVWLAYWRERTPASRGHQIGSDWIRLDFSVLRQRLGARSDQVT